MRTHQRRCAPARRAACGCSRPERPPAAATIELVERERGWELTHVYGLTETSPLITFCEPLPEHERLSLQERAQIKARQGVELVSSGELKVVDEHGKEVAHDGQTLGEIAVRGNVVMKGYYNAPPRGDERRDQEQLVPFRRRRGGAS